MKYVHWCSRAWPRPRHGYHRRRSLAPPWACSPRPSPLCFYLVSEPPCYLASSTATGSPTELHTVRNDGAAPVRCHHLTGARGQLPSQRIRLNQRLKQYLGEPLLLPHPSDQSVPCLSRWSTCATTGEPPSPWSQNPSSSMTFSWPLLGPRGP